MNFNGLFVNNKWKLLLSIAVFYSSMLQGWSEQQVGVALPTIQILIGVDEEKLSTILVVWNVGYVIGSLTSGFLFDKYNRLVLMFLLTICLSVGSFSLPYCPSLAWMLVCRFFIGILIGGTDTGSNTIIPTIWGEECGPFEQLLYVSYAVGGILAPYVTIPFVSEASGPLTNQTMNNSLYNDSDQVVHSESAKAETIHTAFLITNILFISCAIPYILMRCFKKFNSLAGNTLDEEKPNSFEEKHIHYRFLICLMATAHALSVTTEDNLTAYLVTFSTEYLQWSELDSATLMSSYWISSCCFGILSIVIVKFIDHSKILCFAVVLLNSSIGGAILGFYLNQTWLIWAGFILCGCADILIIPTVFPWSQKHVCHISGKVSSVFKVMSGVTSASCAYAIGFIFEKRLELYFLFILLTCTVFCLIFYASAYILRFKCCMNKYNLETEQTIEVHDPITNVSVIMK